MASDDHGQPRSSPARMAASWKVTLVLGVLTIILGVIVSLHPSGSLNTVAVLLGVLMILSGIFQLVRVFDTNEQHRVWLAIGGLLFLVLGVVLIRHLNLTIAVIGLVIGITWIVQGLTGLIAGISGDVRDGRGWWIAFGVISLIAGIVVAAAPITSLNVLATLVGVLFIVMGIFEVIGGFVLRHELRAMQPAHA